MSETLSITTIDAHVAGEPLRVVTGGFPEPEGATMLGKRRFARERLDGLRRTLMLEPRGHADMYGCLPVAPVTADGDVGVLFLHNEGWSTMCGHGIIGLVTVALEHGLLTVDRADPVLRIDTPAGRVTAWAELEGERVASVRFRNVPSFLLARDLTVAVDGLGEVRLDLAFGGAFYAYVDARPLGLALEPSNVPRLIDAARRIHRAVEERHPVAHPEDDPGNDPESAPDLGFLYGVVLHGPGGGGVHGRSVCVFADGEVDRSPTGTGVSGRVAQLVARGELELGRRIEIESVIGTRFRVAAVEETRVGGLAAVVPEVEGSAWVTGRHEFLVSPDDPLREGFLLR